MINQLDVYFDIGTSSSNTSFKIYGVFVLVARGHLLERATGGGGSAYFRSYLSNFLSALGHVFQIFCPP